MLLKSCFRMSQEVWSGDCCEVSTSWSTSHCQMIQAASSMNCNVHNCLKMWVWRGELLFERERERAGKMNDHSQFIKFQQFSKRLWDCRQRVVSKIQDRECCAVSECWWNGLEIVPKHVPVWCVIKVRWKVIWMKNERDGNEVKRERTHKWVNLLRAPMDDGHDFHLLFSMLK